jgi:6-pyruvoyltetrahydropterin/6-carboxytetrahydropterin synthase
MPEYKYRLRVRSRFEAAHSLKWHHKCRELHGHTYHVELVVEGSKLNENGVIVDLAVARGILDAWLPDHRCLNDIRCQHCTGVVISGWIENPTVERIAKKILNDVRTAFKEGGYERYQAYPAEITIWESIDKGGVTVR